MHLAGASVVFQGYEGMPHCFAMIFGTSPAGKDCFEGWAEFCVEAVNKRVERRTTGRWTKAFSKATNHVHVSFDNISKLSDEDVTRLMQEAKQATGIREDEMVRISGAEQSKPRL